MTAIKKILSMFISFIIPPKVFELSKISISNFLLSIILLKALPVIPPPTIIIFFHIYLIIIFLNFIDTVIKKIF